MKTCIFLQIWEIFFHYVLIISFMPLSIPVSSDSKRLFTFLLICCSSDFSHNTLVLCLVILCLRIISTPVYFVKSLHGCWSLLIELCALRHSLVFKCLVIFNLRLLFVFENPQFCCLWIQALITCAWKRRVRASDRVCSGDGSSSSGRAFRPT